MNDEEKELDEINAEIEKEIIEMLEARKRGEEYSFDEEETEEDLKKGRLHFIFLLIMTVILVVVVLFKIITMILSPLGLL